MRAAFHRKQSPHLEIPNGALPARNAGTGTEEVPSGVPMLKAYSKPETCNNEAHREKKKERARERETQSAVPGMPIMEVPRSVPRR